MQFLPVDAIQVPSDRVRKTFDPDQLSELVSSIQTHGLFHALLLRDDGRTLVAGERRLRALRQLQEANLPFLYDGREVAPGMVPTVKLHESDAALVLEAELVENTKRQQLTWQEQAAATEALHALRQQQNVTQTVNGTAREIYGGKGEKASGGGRSQVASDLLIAQFLDDPEVSKAPNRKEALRAIERKLVRGQREALARAFGPSVSEGHGECHMGSMQSVLPGLEGGFDCVIADPPYGIEAHTFANQSAIEHTYADDAELSDNIYSFIAREGMNKTKDSAHAYLFCDPRRFESIRRIFVAKGWRVWPWPLIWFRGTQTGLLPWPEHGPRRTYEAILFALKGDRRVTGVFPDVLNVPHDRAVERGAHKPPALYAELIKRSCLPGDRILDPCCGTGPVFEAARLTNTYGVGIEVEAAAYTQALNRLRGVEEDG